MALAKDLIRETTSTTGTGNISLSGAVSGYGRIQDGIPISSQFHYAIFDGNNREVGTGTLINATTVSRVPETTVDSGVYNNTSPSPISLSGSAEIAIVSSEDLLKFIQTLDQNLSTIDDVAFSSVALPSGDVQVQIDTNRDLYQKAGQIPSLDLQFNKMGGVFSDAHTLPNVVNFTRTSTATYTDATGTIVTAIADQPRFEYDPDTLQPKGLLVEEQRTNLCLQSQFDASWPGIAVSVTQDVGTAPDGTQTAIRIQEDTTNNQHVLFQGQLLEAGKTYTFSVFIKAGERFRAQVGFGQEGGNNYVDVDLNTQQLSLVQDAQSADIIAYSDGWYRVSVTGVAAQSATANSLVRISNDNGNPFYTGDGTSGLYVWGVQLEEGSFPTSYIPTSTAQVTRAAENISLPVDGWYNQHKATFYLDAIPNDTTGTRRYFSVSDGSANNRFSFLSSISGGAGNRVDVFSAGTLQSTIPTASAVVPGDSLKLVAAFEHNNAAAVRNGGVLSIDNTFNMPIDVSIMNLGASFLGGGGLNGHISRLTYWPTRLSNTILQDLAS